MLNYVLRQALIVIIGRYYQPEKFYGYLYTLLMLTEFM